MTNYLDLIEVWEVVKNGYTPKYGTDDTTLTTESKLLKVSNDNAVNAILTEVCREVPPYLPLTETWSHLVVSPLRLAPQVCHSAHLGLDSC